MKTHLAIAFVVACIQFANLPVQGCSCLPPPPPKKALEGSAAVFSGKVTEVKIVDQTKHVTIEVDRVWKGKVGEKVVVTTAVHSATCGFNFTTKGDATYLVYCYETKAGLATNICTRTTTLAAGAADIKELGEGEKVKKEEKAKE